MPHRILLVEDDPRMVLVLTYALTMKGYSVDSTGTGGTALAKAESGIADLIVLDVGLPDRNGFEVCRDLRNRGIGTPVVMLSGRSSVADKVLGLSAGADDYLTKPFDTNELIARIQAQLRRARLEPSATLAEYRFGQVLVDFLTGKVLREGQPLSVSAKEFQLLRYLVTRRGAVLSRTELLAEVWGYRSILTRTVDVHVAALRHKLEENPQQPRYLLTIRGEGYMFRE